MLRASRARADRRFCMSDLSSDRVMSASPNAPKAAAPTAAAAPLQRVYQRWRSTILGTATMAVFLILWELAPRLGLVKPLFTSSPSRIVAAAQWLFANGLWYDIGVSFSEFALGFGLAIVVGIPLGRGAGLVSDPAGHV